MKGDKSVIENLQTSAQMLATLAEQYRVDKHQLKDMGFKKLAKEVCCWYHKTEKHLGKIIDRLLYFETDPQYQPGEVAGSDTVQEILSRALELADGAREQFIEFRKAAWEVQADYTPDIFEHAIKMLECQVEDITEQQALLKEAPSTLLVAA